MDLTHLDRKKSNNIANSASGNAEQSSNGQKLSPPAPHLHPVQQQKVAQREEKKEGKKESKPDIDVKLLPPEVQATFWKFKLKADTGSAKLSFKSGKLGANLGYKYGGGLSGGLGYKGFSAGAAYTPGSTDFSLNAGYKKGPFSAGAAYSPLTQDLSLKGSYKMGKFSAGLGVNPMAGSGSLSLGYGAPLLPMPHTLYDPMNNAGNAITGMAGGLPGAMDDPMAYYKSQEGNIEAIKKAADIAQKLYKEKRGIRFGAGVRIGFDKLGAFNATLGVQGAF